jgi:predicted dehydrogenase
MNDVTRREFLTRSAMAMAAIPAAANTAFPQAGTNGLSKVGPNDQIRVGLIGSGDMGRGDLNTFFQNPEVDCPVVCDVDDAQIAEAVKLVEDRRGHKPEGVKDFRRVIDRTDVDIIIVGTPDHWHALPTIYACQAGKDVYVEKPLGKSIDEGRAMLEAARQNNRIVQMGTQWRSGTHFCDAVEFVRSGKLGKVRMVRTWAYLDWVGGIGHPTDSDPPPGVDYDLWLGPAPKRPFNKNRFHFNFRWFWDYAGGLMTDWGVHLLNVCLWAMSPEVPLRVSSSGGRHAVDDNTEVPDTQVAVYDFPSYTLVFEEQMLGGLGPNGRPHGMLFCGTEGPLIIETGGWEVIPEPKRKSLEAAKHGAGPDARPAHVRNFLDCVQSREQPVENLEIGHFVSTVAHLGNLAYMAKSEIHWDGETEKITNCSKADEMVGCEYRKPWRLPYGRRSG